MTRIFNLRSRSTTITKAIPHRVENTRIAEESLGLRPYGTPQDPCRELTIHECEIGIYLGVVAWVVSNVLVSTSHELILTLAFIYDKFEIDFNFTQFENFSSQKGWKMRGHTEWKDESSRISGTWGTKIHTPHDDSDPDETGSDPCMDGSDPIRVASDPIRIAGKDDSIAQESMGYTKQEIREVNVGSNTYPESNGPKEGDTLVYADGVECRRWILREARGNENGCLLAAVLRYLRWAGDSRWSQVAEIRRAMIEYIEEL